MAGGGGGGGGGATTAAAASTGTTRSLQETPTWALATVCFIFIFGGLLIEYLIHRLTHLLKHRRKNALYEAVERLKSVLMLLGFLSLLLAVTQRPISKICIPNRLANSMLPCKVVQTKTTKALGYYSYDHARAAYDQADISHWERRLAEDDSSSSSDDCGKGKTSLMSAQGTNQLSIFIFVIAVMQVVYSGVTMGLGRAKMRRWKAWEKETQTVEYQAANDPNRFRLTRQTTFGRRHMNNWTTTPVGLWIKCFFRQFFHSVAKVDYFTLRHGFIAAHLSTNNTFNFQKYIRRSLEDDFKVIVSISPAMWFLVVIFLLVDVYGWHTVLIIGTKLEVIVAKMALQLKDHNSVVNGTPVVQPNDNLFWFGHPEYVLTLIHYILFTNAFELAFFVFVTLQYGFHSCYHERVEIVIVRVVLAVTVQVLCSYITLPLYALVTQMGTHFKSAVLEDQTAHMIRQWHAGVREKRKKGRAGSKSPRRDREDSVWSNTNSRTNSPESSSSRYRTPTLAEFASHRLTTRDDGEIVAEEQSPAELSFVDEGRIELPGDMRKSAIA
ncbi:hypothetical protein RHMOL_Rhmol01G0297600 [Rhododendron molle]|uniref:Uncharacterized protein n=1 Tax=Rhododendron molle TaxID=49168 RepID=A0ACC0QAF1_RHOML|nr:hypothetical protein RHMOL_Rhmol01G0297600 [Rhododendron molle]